MLSAPCNSPRERRSRTGGTRVQRGVGGDTLTDGGGYVRDCVGGARMVCAALSPTLHSQGSSHD